MSTKHTPTPWNISEELTDQWHIVIETNCRGTVLVERMVREDEGLAEANAAHIVRCVNLHDELVHIAQSALELMYDSKGHLEEKTRLDAIESLKDLLDRAKGGE